MLRAPHDCIFLNVGAGRESGFIVITSLCPVKVLFHGNYWSWVSCHLVSKYCSLKN